MYTDSFLRFTWGWGQREKALIYVHPMRLLLEFKFFESSTLNINVYLPYPHLFRPAIPSTPKEPRYCNVFVFYASLLRLLSTNSTGTKMNTLGARSASTFFFSSIIDRQLDAQAGLNLQVIRPRSAAGAAAGSAGRSLVHDG